MIYKKSNITLNPYQLYALVSREYKESFLFESMEGDKKLARFSFIGFDPKKHITAKGNTVSVENEEFDSNDPIRTLAQHIPRLKIKRKGFVGGAVGYFSYDAVRTFENLPKKAKDDLNFPDFEFGIFEDCIIYDHIKRSVHYLSSSTIDRSKKIDKLTKEEVFLGPFEVGSIKYNMSKEEYEDAVNYAKKLITAGEIFQVQLSRRCEFPFEGNILRFYNILKQINPSPYMYCLNFGDRKIVGSSPENLVRVENRKIDSYATLAGTKPRGKTKSEDKKLERELLNDKKERAEHLMLVDLTRNDVGKVSKFNSVSVPELMKVHKYSHVQHMGSYVTGELEDGKDCFDAFKALFPAGTISGAPKVRAMEIIEEIEPNRRGPYAGAVGYFSFNGNCDFAISIRTLFAQRQKAYIQAAAGIVYDSKPEMEYYETENKMSALISSLSTIGD